MNFPYRDNFGEVDPVQREIHLRESVTVDALIQHSQGKTLRELQFEVMQADPAAVYGIEVSEQGLGPEGHRYIRDVNNPGRVIDMRHFIESADVPFGQGEALGFLTEIQQGREGIDSAWEKEDLNSNFLGAVFRNNYYDPNGDISQQFKEFFNDYEKRELKGIVPAVEYLIDDVIDLGRDAQRALQQLGNTIEQQTQRLSQPLENRLRSALDNLRSFIDPPAYAEEVEDKFEQAENQIQRPYYDPLILDLDGDGIELTSIDDLTVRFDIDGDGFREATGWVSPHDGFLVYDRNKDGYINDISELFGKQNISGFTELQKLDSNNDGQITAADTNFADLQVWRDLDQDGYSDAQELFTLQEYNITKIGVVGNSVSISNKGNLINEIGSFELADGTKRQVANVLLNIDQQNSYYDPYSTFNSQIIITPKILSLPNLRGYGNLPDLRIAMAKDSKLLAMVESLAKNANLGNISAASELIRPIMLLWSGIDGLNTSSSNNSNAFAQELKFIEKFVGRTWNNTNPSVAGIATIRNTFSQLESELETRLLAQVVQTSVEYNTTTEKYEFSGSINEVAEQFKQIAINSQTSSSETLNFEATVLGEFIQQSASRNNLVFNVFAANEDVTLEILASNSLSFSGIQDAVNGTAVINADGNIVFTPAANFNGIAIIEYTVTDGTKTLTGLAQVNVAPVNDAPVANSDTATTDEDTPIIILATELLANDSDVDRDTLSITSISNAVNGTAVINADGNIKFTPGANFNGIASFDYTVSDGINRNKASIKVVVNPVNDAPLANNDTATAIDEDTSITILAAELLANDRDVEGDSLSIINVNSNSGTVILNAEGNIRFTPAANFNGTATFDYTVSDSKNSSTASVKVVVNSINDAPVLTGLMPDITLTKNAADSVIDLSDYFEDIENG